MQEKEKEEKDLIETINNLVENYSSKLKDNLGDDYRLEMLNENNINEIISLQNENEKSPTYVKGNYASKNAAEFKNYLIKTDDRKGYTFGIFHRNNLVAYSILHIPNSSGLRDENGKIIDPKFKIINDEEWKYKTCFLESVMVKENYRGKGLQSNLINIRIEMAALLNIKWVCSGVKYNNYGSLKNLIGAGMAIVDYRIDKENNRYFLGLVLRQGNSLGEFTRKEKTIDIKDNIEEQIKLIDSNFICTSFDGNCFLYKQIATKFIALGDSYTHCEGVSRKEEWTFLLQNDKECNLELVKVIAASGWTSENLLEKCMKYLALYEDFKTAMVFIGVNDWYDGVPSYKFRANLTELLFYLIKEREKKVVLINIPNFEYPAVIQRKIDGLTISDFNKIIASIAIENNLPLVELENKLKAGSFPDGQHPDSAGVNIWFQEIKKTVLNNAK